MNKYRLYIPLDILMFQSLLMDMDLEVPDCISDETEILYEDCAYDNFLIKYLYDGNPCVAFAFTTPGQAKEYMKKKGVLGCFEFDMSEFTLINRENYDYLINHGTLPGFTQYLTETEKRNSRIVSDEMRDEVNVREALEYIKSSLLKVYNYHYCYALVEKIACKDLKAILQLDGNNEWKEFKDFDKYKAEVMKAKNIGRTIIQSLH